MVGQRPLCRVVRRTFRPIEIFPRVTTPPLMPVPVLRRQRQTTAGLEITESIRRRRDPDHPPLFQACLCPRTKTRKNCLQLPTTSTLDGGYSKGWPLQSCWPIGAGMPLGRVMRSARLCGQSSVCRAPVGSHGVYGAFPRAWNAIIRPPLDVPALFAIQDNKGKDP